ncbi:MAG: recombinase family protein [Porticoccaceae bacterium]
MTVYAYARVSTDDQNVDQQIALLEKYNPDYSITEKFTGTTLARPKFNKLISQLKSGDTLVVREVSRLGRKTSDVLNLAEELQGKGVKLVIDNLGELDITSQTGKLLFLLLSGLAEMERETMLERQRIGIERAKTEGRYKGRKALDKAVIDTAKDLIAKGMKKKEVAKQLKIGESTLYKYLQ